MINHHPVKIKFGKTRARGNRGPFKSLFIHFFVFQLLYSPAWSGNQVFSQKVWPFITLCLFVPMLLRLAKGHADAICSQIHQRYYLLIIASMLYYFIISSAAIGRIDLIESRILQNLFPLVSLLNIIALTELMRRLGYTSCEGLSVLVTVATIQGVICCLMLAFPTFGNVAKQMYLQNSNFREGDYILLTRIFGIASDYTYGMPIVNGIVAGLSFFMGINKNSKYFMNTVFILISVITNGRTGVLVALACFIAAFLMSPNLANIKVSVIFGISLMIVLLVLFYRIISNYFPELSRFVNQLFTSLQDGTGNIDYLTNEDHLYLPKGLGLLFGEGHRVYGVEAASKGYKATDIGFVNDLFMGGLFYIVLRYSATCTLIISHGNLDIKFEKYITTILIVMWFIANYKGQASINPSIIIVIQLLFQFRNHLESSFNNEEGDVIDG